MKTSAASGRLPAKVLAEIRQNHEFCRQPPLPGRPGLCSNMRISASGGAQALLPGEPFALLVAQEPPQPLQVGRQHRQRHRAGKAPLAMVPHPVQPAMLKTHSALKSEHEMN